MFTPDVTGWRFMLETSNTVYYEVEPGILATLPHPGAIDDLTTATENIRRQHDYWRAAGRPGVVLVFFDRMASQDREARRVYQASTDPAVIRGTALIGGSMLARAMMSFFLGLTRLRVPAKPFATVEDAISWARELNRTCDERDRDPADALSVAR